MKVHAATDNDPRSLNAQGTAFGWDVVQVPASKPGKFYTVDVTHGRCSCPAWKFQKVGPGGTRTPCKHLRSLGFKQVMANETTVAEPKQGAALMSYEVL